MKAKASTQATSAIIYCRVSSVAQVQKGHGLGSQETRCQEFARMKGYAVEGVFSDEAVSGGLIDRPGVKSMLAFLRAHRKASNWVVIIDDISRLARSMQAHLELRSAIAAAGARLESPSVEFGEDSDSLLVEHLLASVSQHQRQKNAEQTLNRMRARVMSGYYPFIACMGLRHEFRAGEGRVLIRDEPVASIIQEAMEGFAAGRFRSQAEVKRFLESQPDFPKDGTGGVRNQLVNDILTKHLYAGYVAAPNWGVSMRKGRHEGLVSFETFERIQQRLNAGARCATRAGIDQDFPLRGTVACAHCGKPLTSCWSTSETGVKHPYYMCFGKGCGRYRKSIKRDKIESDFAALLGTLVPSRRLYDIALKLFKDAWSQRVAQAAVIATSYAREAAKIEKQVALLLDRIVDSGSQSVVSAYEKRIDSLERQKLLLTEKQQTAQSKKGTFEELFERAMLFLASPLQMWNAGGFEHKRLVLRLTFADHLAYCPKEGFRTPETTMPFKMLEGIKQVRNKMAGDAGFEPMAR